MKTPRSVLRTPSASSRCPRKEDRLNGTLLCQLLSPNLPGVSCSAASVFSLLPPSSCLSATPLGQLLNLSKLLIKAEGAVIY